MLRDPEDHSRRSMAVRRLADRMADSARESGSVPEESVRRRGTRNAQTGAYSVGTQSRCLARERRALTWFDKAANSRYRFQRL